jgi:hypothetical protein
MDPFWSPKGFQFVMIQAVMLVTHGFHFDHPNGSILVTQGVPFCIQAAMLVTQGFHFHHPNVSGLVTQGDPICILAAM